MSEQSEPRDVEPIEPTREVSTTDWIWWTVLVVSCVVGFGMTIFAPT